VSGAVPYRSQVTTTQPKQSEEQPKGVMQNIMSSLGLVSSVDNAVLQPVGLVNNNNLCFFNSVLQLLSRTPGLKESILQEVIELNEPDKTEVTVCSVLIALYL